MLSLVRAIKAAAEHNAAAPALITGSRIITYKELLDLIARISNLVADRGLAPLSKIFINIADPDLRVATMIACMHAGMIPFALLEVGDQKGDVDYDFVVGAPERFVPEPAPDLVLDQNSLSGPSADVGLRDFPDRKDEDILYVTSSSGTTGRRKLIAELYRSFEGKVSVAKGAEPAPEVRRLRSTVEPGARIMTTAGDMTKPGMGQVFRHLAAGATHVRFDRNLPRCLRLINILGVTRLSTSPAAIADIMDCMEAEGVRCPSVRRISLTGSFFRKPLVQRIEALFDANITVGYGTSETGPIAGGPISAATFEAGYVGELEPHVTLVSAGSKSEPRSLVVVSRRGDHSPYYSAGRLLSKSGDMFSLPDIGYLDGFKLYLLGRDDEVFNVSGMKTTFSVIEGELRELAGVRDVGVVPAAGIGDPGGMIVAVVAAGEVSPTAIIEHICQVAKVPRAHEHVHLFVTDKIARNSTGKVDRAALVQSFKARRGIIS